MSDIVESNVPLFVVSCNHCTHYIKDGKCLAYPAKIPTFILNGSTQHTQPLKGQVGEYVFTKKETNA